MIRDALFSTPTRRRRVPERPPSRWENALVVLVGDRRLIETQLAALDAGGTGCALPAPVLVDGDGNAR